MKVYVAKDDYSFYLIGLFDNQADQLNFDWSLSRSYSIVLGEGSVSVNGTTKAGIGIFDINPETQVTMIAQEARSIVFCSFLLDDDAVMNELFPTGSTLSQLRNSSSNLIDIQEALDFEKVTPTLSFDGDGTTTTLSIADINAKVIEGL